MIPRGKNDEKGSYVVVDSPSNKCFSCFHQENTGKNQLYISAGSPIYACTHEKNVKVTKKGKTTITKYPYCREINKDNNCKYYENSARVYFVGILTFVFIISVLGYIEQVYFR